MNKKARVPIHELDMRHKEFSEMIQKEMGVTAPIELENLIERGLSIHNQLDLNGRLLYLKHYTSDAESFPFIPYTDYLAIVKERIGASNLEDTEEILNRRKSMCLSLRRDNELFFNAMQSICEKFTDKESINEYINEYCTRDYRSN